MVADKAIIFRLTDEEHAKFKAHCKAAKVSMSANITNLIRAWMAQQTPVEQPATPTPAPMSEGQNAANSF